MSGNGVMTSFSRSCLAPGQCFVMFRVFSASFSPQITQITSRYSHARPMEVTWVIFCSGDLRRGHKGSHEVTAFFANKFLLNRDTDACVVSSCSARQDASNDMFLYLFWPNLTSRSRGLMMCFKMNAGHDAGSAQLCAVALSRICSLAPFDWQNENIHIDWMNEISLLCSWYLIQKSQIFTGIFGLDPLSTVWPYS